MGLMQHPIDNALYRIIARTAKAWYWGVYLW